MKRVSIDGQRLRLPIGLRARKNAAGTLYFYLTLASTAKEISVGCDYKKAIEMWETDRHHVASKSMQLVSPEGLQFRWVASQYRLQVTSQLPVKAQAPEDRLIQRLIKYWAAHQLNNITQQQIEEWFLQRLSISHVRASAEKSSLAHIFSWAQKQGYAAYPMPVVSTLSLNSAKSYRPDEIITRLLKRDAELLAICKSVGHGQLFKHQSAKLFFEQVRAAEIADLVLHKRSDMVSYVQKFKWSQFCDRLIYCIQKQLHPMILKTEDDVREVIF